MHGKLIWVTGLCGSGKTTLGKALYNILKNRLSNTVFLDGDSFREIMGNDLGHNAKDRLENARRISRMCRFLTESGINVVCSTVSLYKEIHSFNRENNKEYYEIYIHCDMDELIKRDQKCLYTKALNGEVKDVPGVDLEVDKPGEDALYIDNSQLGMIKEKVEKIMEFIGEH